MDQSIIKCFPSDIIDIILSFYGINKRNGKYINSIDKTDFRYSVLYTIPLKEYYNNQMTVQLDINDDRYFILCSDIFLNNNRITLILFEDYYIHFNAEVNSGVRFISAEEHLIM